MLHIHSLFGLYSIVSFFSEYCCFSLQLRESGRPVEKLVFRSLYCPWAFYAEFAMSSDSFFIARHSLESQQLRRRQSRKGWGSEILNVCKVPSAYLLKFCSFFRSFFIFKAIHTRVAAVLFTLLLPCKWNFRTTKLTCVYIILQYTRCVLRLL